MENFEKKPDSPAVGNYPEPEKAHPPLPLSRQAVALVVALSVFFGASAGATGYWFASQSGQGKNLKPNPNPPVKSAGFFEEDSAVIDVVKKASPAVVSIVISKKVSNSNVNSQDPFWPFYLPYSNPDNAPDDQTLREVGAGSGFFISSDGLILTNRHVVSDEQASYTVITTDEKEYEAKVLARDTRNDLALVKVDITGAPFLDLADSSSLQIGQRVIAIGNSLGQYHNTVTTGVVSGIGRSITAGDADSQEQLEGVVQTDAAINPGNSGGPLLNVVGQVVGINTAVDQEGQLLGFAIPSSDAARAVDSYKKYGRIVRPYMGIRYAMIDKETAASEKLPYEYGALVVRGQGRTETAVVPGSPADKAGLEENDIILEIDGQKLDRNMTLSKFLRQKNPGDTINLKVYHRGQEKMVQLKLEEAK